MNSSKNKLNYKKVSFLNQCQTHTMGWAEFFSLSLFLAYFYYYSSSLLYFWDTFMCFTVLFDIIYEYYFVNFYFYLPYLRKKNKKEKKERKKEEGFLLPAKETASA